MDDPRNTSQRPTDVWPPRIDPGPAYRPEATPTRPLAAIATALLWAYVAVDALQEMLDLSSGILSHQPVLGALANAVDVTGIILVSAAFVLFLVWLFKSHVNLQAYGVWGLRTSPQWAVASFFIPVANLLLPYQALQEVWKGSDPDISERAAPEQWRTTPRSNHVLAWWILFLIEGLFLGGLVVFGFMAAFSMIMGEAQSATGPISWNTFEEIFDAFEIAMVVSWILMINSVTQRQEQKSAKLRERSAPPYGSLR